MTPPRLSRGGILRQAAPGVNRDARWSHESPTVARIVTCVPTSITRPVGIWKKSVASVADLRKPDEELVLPLRHARMGGRLDGAPRQEERRRHDVEGPAVLARDRQRLRHVRLVHEAVLESHAAEQLGHRRDASRVRFRGTRGVSAKIMVRMTLCSCRTLLCLRLCSSAVGAKSGSLVRNTAVPGTMCGDFFSRLCDQGFDRNFGAAGLLHQDAGAAAPGGHRQHDESPEQHRQPGALTELQQRCDQKRAVDDRKRADQQSRRPELPSPHLPDHDERQQRRHRGWSRPRRARRRRPGRSTCGTVRPAAARRPAARCSRAACRSARKAPPRYGGSQIAATVRAGSPDG